MEKNLPHITTTMSIDPTSEDSFYFDDYMLKEFIFPIDEAIMEAINIDRPPWNSLIIILPSRHLR